MSVGVISYRNHFDLRVQRYEDNFVCANNFTFNVEILMIF